MRPTRKYTFGLVRLQSSMAGIFDPNPLQSEWHIQMPVLQDMVGIYVVEHGNLVDNGQWPSDEAAQSSTWRELRAVIKVLVSFQSKLKNECIR